MPPPCDFVRPKDFVNILDVLSKEAHYETKHKCLKEAAGKCQFLQKYINV